VKLLFLGRVWSHYRGTLEERLGDRHELVFFDDVADPGVPEHVPDAHVIVTAALPEALGRSARALRLVHSVGAGVNQIHMSAVAAGVPLCRTLHHGPSMAEHVVMVILALHRNLFGQDRDLREGRWRIASYDPREGLQSSLVGKTVVVLGTGEIGVHVAARCRALGLHLVGVNRSGLAPEEGEFDEIRASTALDETLTRADFLVVAVPLSDETRGLIDARRLDLMKKEAFLINISRGPVVDEAALYSALEAGRIAGAAIDVWYRYPRSPGEVTPPSSLPFGQLSNVIMTPHSSGMTTATFDRRVDDIVDNIERLERGEPLHDVVAFGEGRDT
jgi:phosphoglycerate dehydrogenase-like enzyme